MMTDEDRVELGKFLAQLRNHYQASAEAIDAFLNYLGQRVVDRESAYDKLPWESKEGAKGPFQMVSSRSCNNSDCHCHLQAILKQNKGRYTEKGWTHYYWLGQDETAIFRREKKRFTK